MFQLELVDTASGARRTVPLGGDPLLIGSAVDCDLVLPGADVAAHQCRVEPGEGGFRLVHLADDHAGDTALNGRPIGRAVLRVGDVVRVGSYQLTVVGTAAAAPAELRAAPAAAAAPPPPPAAAPAAPAASAASAASAGRRPAARSSRGDGRGAPERGDGREGRGGARARASSGTPAAAIGAVIMVALVIGAFLLMRGGSDDGRVEAQALQQKMHDARQKSDECSFDDALRLASEAVGASTGADRQSALQLEQQIKDRKARYLKGKSLIEGLRSRVARDMNGATVGEVARFADQYSDIDPLREQILAIQDDLKARLNKPAPPPDLEGITLPVDRTVADCAREAQKWLDKGEFAKAHFILMSVQAKDAAEKKQQDEQLAKVNAGAQKAGDEILRRVDEQLKLGHVLQALGEFDDDNLKTLKGTDVWYDLLVKADEVEDLVDSKIPEHARPVPRRKHARTRPKPAEAAPADAGAKQSSRVDHAGREEGSGTPLSAPGIVEPPRAAGFVFAWSLVALPPAAPRQAAPAAGRSALALQEQARAHLAQGDFAQAKVLLELALDSAPPSDRKGEIARDHERAARPLALAARLAELLAARPLSGAPELRMRDGRRGKLVRSDGTQFIVQVAGVETAVAPAELAARSLLDLSGRTSLTAAESLDRAFLALACGDRKAFFASLDKALLDAATGAALRGSIDSALAFERGLDRIPARGFVRVGEKWLTWEEKAQEELRREVRATIAAVLAPNGDPARTRAAVVELAGVAPALVIEELSGERARLAKAFAAAPEQEKLAKLRAKATELRSARKHALELIFDEEKYFYPYAPPACPPDKAAKYAEVQQEVDLRVAAVRQIWGREESDPPEPHVTIPAALDEEVRQLKLLRTLLFDLGRPKDAADGALQAAWCLPTGARSLHLRNFAFDEYERARLDQDAKILVLNASVAPADAGPSREELDQVAVTNQYRALLGRRLLACNAKLWSAARLHSDWMSRVGRLSHFEDDPERASPEQRMKLAGYDHGAGENCAVGRTGALEVLHGWCHSSGHHRNLLYDSHTELGAGQSGSYWTQCFGGGREYKGNLIRD